VLYFANDGDEEIYIGSADWMHRNLSRRVEVVCPIDDPRLRAYLKDKVLQTYLRDNVNARELQADGTYRSLERPLDEELFDSQTYFEGRDSNFSVVER
jgi:polyphosphate kinase